MPQDAAGDERQDEPEGRDGEEEEIVVERIARVEAITGEAEGEDAEKGHDV